MRHAPHVVAVAAVIMFAGFATLVVPQAIAPSHPVVDPGATLLGHVSSDAGGSLGGAWVTVTSETTEDTQNTLTGPDGAFQFWLGAGTYNLTVTASGHASHSERVVVVAEGVPAEKDITLQHTGPALRGHVTDAKTGAGLKGAVVEAYSASDQPQPCPEGMACPMYYPRPVALSTMTGADGAYALGIPAGAAKVHVYRDGYQDVWGGGDEYTKDTTLDFQLQAVPAKSAMLAGKVTDAKSGAPIAGAWVNAWPTYDAQPVDDGAQACEPQPDGTEMCKAYPMPVPPSDGYYREGNNTQTGRDGSFRMGLQPGRFQVQVSAENYGQFTTEVTVEDGQATTMDAELQPIPGTTVTLRGKVTDLAGKAVPWAWVSVENPQWGHYDGTQADEGGAFTLHTKPGWNVVWVRVDNRGYATPVAMEGAAASDTAAGSGGATAPSSTEPSSPSGIRAPEPYPGPYHQPEGSFYPWVWSKVLEDGATETLSVKLTPRPKADVRMVGYVVNATSQKAIPGAWVNVYNEDTGDWGSAQTDKDGSFVLMGRAGFHTVRASADGYFENAVVVQVKGPETRVDLFLQPGRSQGYCCVMYAKGGVAYAEGARTADGAPPPAAPQPGGTSAPQASGGADSTTGTGGAQAPTGTATYTAGSGGLGPYKPAPGGATSGPSGTDGAGPSVQTPGAGLLAVLGALGAVALVLRARKR